MSICVYINVHTKYNECLNQKRNVKRSANRNTKRKDESYKFNQRPATFTHKIYLFNSLGALPGWLTSKLKGVVSLMSDMLSKRKTFPFSSSSSHTSIFSSSA